MRRVRYLEERALDFGLILDVSRRAVHEAGASFRKATGTSHR